MENLQRLELFSQKRPFPHTLCIPDQTTSAQSSSFLDHTFRAPFSSFRIFAGVHFPDQQKSTSSQMAHTEHGT